MSGAGLRGASAALAGACILSLLPIRDGAAAEAGAPPQVTARAESRLTGRIVPDIPLTLADGRRVQISELWRGKPLLVTFYYRHCAGSCQPFLSWVRDAVTSVGGLARDYRVLALTFDDRETTADLHAQAAAFDLLDAPGWTFAMSSREDVARLADALEFRYRYDPTTSQYDHTSLLVGIDKGKVVRALLGTPEGNARFRELVWELRGRFLPTYRVPGRTLLGCVTFDPVSGRMRLDWGMLLLILPAVTAISLALLLFMKPGTQLKSFSSARIRGGSPMSR